MIKFQINYHAQADDPTIVEQLNIDAMCFAGVENCSYRRIH
jgi:hypothetical protein